MSWQLGQAPQCSPSDCNPIDVVITPTAKNIGDFDVRRALPARERQRIGPFIFFDQMGPVEFRTGQAMDVRPHPHIGISTITWLFAGEIRHQDSLGIDLVIRPGEVNWMTAGRGIVHSERSPKSSRRAKAKLAGIQAWMALPLAKEEIEPAFYHYSADELPCYQQEGIRLVLIAGQAFGQRSPIKTESDTFYAELRLDKDTSFVLPADIPERGIYVYEGSITIGGTTFNSGTLTVLKPGLAVELTATDDALCMLLGGAPLEGERHLYWNFVSSSKARIEKAKQDWRENRFPLVPGDHEYIPLPE